MKPIRLTDTSQTRLLLGLAFLLVCIAGFRQVGFDRDSLQYLESYQQFSGLLGADFKTVVTPNDDSLGAVLLSGEAPLAVMSMGEFRARPEALRNTLRIVTEFAKVPGFLVMANPALPAAERQRLKALLLALGQSEEGRRFQALAGVSQIREVTEAELKTLDNVTEATRKALGG